MLRNVIIATIIAAILVTLIIILKSKRNKKYFYKFYTNKLVYKNTYFGNKAKEVNYNEFKEIRYNQTFIQSKFNLGEIYILTNNKNIFKKILTLKSIPNVEKNYERIVKLFNT